MNRFFLKAKSFEKWINHPIYFAFCVAVSLGLWTLSLESKKEELKSIQLSSIADGVKEVQDNESETIKKLSEKRGPSGVPKKPAKKKLPKKFKGNPAFKLFEKVDQLINQKKVPSPVVVSYRRLTRLRE